MRRVMVMDVFTHPIAQKYLNRSGISHAISVAEYAVQLAIKHDVNPDSRPRLVYFMILATMNGIQMVNGIMSNM